LGSLCCGPSKKTPRISLFSFFPCQSAASPLHAHPRPLYVPTPLLLPPLSPSLLPNLLLPLPLSSFQAAAAAAGGGGGGVGGGRGRGSVPVLGGVGVVLLGRPVQLPTHTLLRLRLRLLLPQPPPPDPPSPPLLSRGGAPPLPSHPPTVLLLLLRRRRRRRSSSSSSSSGAAWRTPCQEPTALSQRGDLRLLQVRRQRLRIQPRTGLSLPPPSPPAVLAHQVPL